MLCRAVAPMPGHLHHDYLDTCSAQQTCSLRSRSRYKMLVNAYDVPAMATSLARCRELCSWGALLAAALQYCLVDALSAG